MPKMIGNRDDWVPTLQSYMVQFKEGKETYVPENEAVIKECLQRGHKLATAEPKGQPESRDPAVKPAVKPATKSA